MTAATAQRAYAHSEAQLETLFLLRVRGLGGMLVKLAPTVAGIPDRLVLLPCNRIRLVELKTTTGRLSPIQQHWHARAGALGVRVDVLRGLPEIDAWTRARAREYDHLMELL